MSYPLDIKLKARSLFVESGFTFEQVASETNVSISQIKNWGKEQDWSKERDEFERDVLSAHSGLQRFKVQALRNVLGKKEIDQKDLNTLNTLAAVTKAMGRMGPAQRKEESRANLFLEFMTQEVAFLKERDPEALRYLLPHMKAFAEHVKTDQS